jgi:hypothetical protein
MKTIHFFGDSWTRGDGCQFEPGSGIIAPHKKYGPDYSKEYNTFSYPAQFGKLLNNQYNIINTAFSGGSNFQIYRTILAGLKNNNFKKNDIVIVGWSSIIREPLNFLFTLENQDKMWDNHNINYSIKSYTHPKDAFLPSWITQMRDSESKKISKKIYEDFIVDRINLNLLYEICMNYVCNLQILFEEIGVDYIFINTFERIVNEEIFFHSKIKKDKWILFDSTLSDYLCDIEDTIEEFPNGYSLWEDDHIKPGRNLDGPHPNRIGYGHIAELLHKEFLNKNLL